MTKIMKNILMVTVCAITTMTSVAQAEILTYFCKVKAKIHPIKVDDKKKTLEWLGKKYTIRVSNPNEPNGCAKSGWHVGPQRVDGTSFNFCTATQGVAGIEYDDGKITDCDKRRSRL
jgi:hypothetical protein